MSVTVRPAREADAEAIAAVHVTAWQETYRHLVDPARLDALDPADRVERWSEIISTDLEDVWVAELDGAIVAWATASARNPARHPRPREVNGIYAVASAHGPSTSMSAFRRPMPKPCLFKRPVLTLCCRPLA